jgi:uncharacterized protein (DUF736 family)
MPCRRRPTLALRAFGCGAAPCRLPMRIEAALVRPEQWKDIIMSKIGTFKLVSGEYQGEIITLSVQAHAVRIVPEKGSSGNAPSHRVFVGDAEVGAAWQKTSQDQRTYLSVKLDDPCFVAPIFAQLFAGEGDTHDLVWSRQPRRGDN